VALIIIGGLLLLCCLICCLWVLCFKGRDEKEKEGVQASQVNVQVAQPSANAQPAVDFALIESKIPKMDIESADPEAERKAIKSKLREYEQAFENREGRPPRKRADWGDMWPNYEKYINLRRVVRENSSTDIAPPLLGSGLAEGSTNYALGEKSDFSLGEKS